MACLNYIKPPKEKAIKRKLSNIFLRRESYVIDDRLESNKYNSVVTTVIIHISFGT